MRTFNEKHRSLFSLVHFTHFILLLLLFIINMDNLLAHFKGTNCFSSLSSTTSLDIDTVCSKLNVVMDSEIKQFLSLFAGKKLAVADKNTSSSSTNQTYHTPTLWALNSSTNSWRSFDLGAFYHFHPLSGEEYLDELSIIQANINLHKKRLSFQSNKHNEEEKKSIANDEHKSSSSSSSSSIIYEYIGIGETMNGDIIAIEMDTKSIIILTDFGCSSIPYLLGESLEEWLQRMYDGVKPSSNDVVENDNSFNTSNNNYNELNAYGIQELEYEGNEEDLYIDGEEDDDGQLHPSYACDNCLNEIPPTVSRYTCQQCDDGENSYDLCGACKELSKDGKLAMKDHATHTSDHTYIRIPPMFADESEEEEQKE